MHNTIESAAGRNVILQANRKTVLCIISTNKYKKEYIIMKRSHISWQALKKLQKERGWKAIQKYKTELH